jgi:hypothetical protein
MRARTKKLVALCAGGLWVSATMLFVACEYSTVEDNSSLAAQDAFEHSFAASIQRSPLLWALSLSLPAILACVILFWWLRERDNR